MFFERAEICVKSFNNSDQLWVSFHASPSFANDSRRSKKATHQNNNGHYQWWQVNTWRVAQPYNSFVWILHGELIAKVKWSLYFVQFQWRRTMIFSFVEHQFRRFHVSKCRFVNNCSRNIMNGVVTRKVYKYAAICDRLANNQTQFLPNDIFSICK